MKAGVLVHPVRLACPGKPSGPSLYHLPEVIGKEKALARILRALGEILIGWSPMSKSQFVERLDMIQAAVHSFLRPLGFRKKGRTHNRRTNGELIHVVNFQMGEYPIGENYVIPGMRENLYGKFTVNLGVLLPCVYQAEWQRPPADFIQEYDCSIRQRLETLALGKDEWFLITSETSGLATRLVDLLDRFGLDFFEKFQTYEDVLSYFNKHENLPFRNAARASLDAALIACHVGNKHLAQSLFQKAYSSEHEGFRKHVAKLAIQVGYAVG